MLRLKVQSDNSLVISGVNSDGNIIATIKCEAESAEALRDALLELYPQGVHAHR